jgi:uncharacterized protein RhaS with RHS repeats
LGRWLSRDPLDLRGGLNVYGYVGNDTLNRVDPSGAEPIDFARCLLAGGGLKKCIEEERERFDHGPAGDCQNCGPAAAPPGGSGGGGAGGGGGGGGGPYRSPDPDALELGCKQKAANKLKDCLKKSFGKGAGAAVDCFDKYAADLAKCRKDAGLTASCPLPVFPVTPPLPIGAF